MPSYEWQLKKEKREQKTVKLKNARMQNCDFLHLYFEFYEQNIIFRCTTSLTFINMYVCKWNFSETNACVHILWEILA